MRIAPALVLPLVLLSACAVARAERIDTHAERIDAPSGRVSAEFRVRAGRPVLDVAFDGVRVVAVELGLAFAEGGALSDLAVTGVRRDAVDRDAALPFGKASRARERYRAAVVSLRERAAPFRRVDVAVRSQDDGVAFRYLLPRQSAFERFAITDETTRFAFAGDPRAYALQLPFRSAYEGYYRKAALSGLEAGATYGLPLLLAPARGPYVAITEADLVDYAGMYLAPVPGAAGVLASVLAPALDDPRMRVRGATPFASPWRVLLIGDRPGALIESNLVALLNPPSRIADTSWIRPGKVQFPWWNGYRMPEAPPGSRVALNTETLKRYIDFCAEHGIPYHSIDGFNFEYAWYGGPVVDYAGADVTRPIAQIDLPAVLAYGRRRGVGTRLWVHYQGLQRDLDHALATYEAWGVEGIMVDFVNRDDQAMVRWVADVVCKAAGHHLTVTFHGIFKPTGLERSWPNLLGYEGVLGMEYDKWSPIGSTPDHELLLPFVRGLAGPFDTHQGSFSPVLQADYRPDFAHPHTIGTLVRQVATYVVYDNPMPMLADAPSAYRAEPDVLAFLSAIPTAWDETRVLHGVIGQAIVTARRKGADWYVGAMNARAPLALDLPLAFLGAGAFDCTILGDGSDAERDPRSHRLRRQTLSARDRLPVRLSAAGGQVVRCLRAPAG